MVIESVSATENGWTFALGDNLPTSLMVWEAIKKCIITNIPNAIVKVLPGPNLTTDNDIIEISFNQAVIHTVSAIQNIIADISINKYCQVFYKEQIVTPD